MAGLTLTSIPWENEEIDVDDYIESFYTEGREDELLEPSHFQGLFLIMGIMISAGLGKLSLEKFKGCLNFNSYSYFDT